MASQATPSRASDSCARLVQADIWIGLAHDLVLEFWMVSLEAVEVERFGGERFGSVLYIS